VSWRDRSGLPRVDRIIALEFAIGVAFWLAVWLVLH